MQELWLLWLAAAGMVFLTVGHVLLTVFLTKRKRPRRVVEFAKANGYAVQGQIVKSRTRHPVNHDDGTTWLYGAHYATYRYEVDGREYLRKCKLDYRETVRREETFYYDSRNPKHAYTQRDYANVRPGFLPTALLMIMAAVLVKLIIAIAAHN